MHPTVCAWFLDQPLGKSWPNDERARAGRTSPGAARSLSTKPRRERAPPPSRLGGGASASGVSRQPWGCAASVPRLASVLGLSSVLELLSVRWLLARLGRGVDARLLALPGGDRRRRVGERVDPAA